VVKPSRAKKAPKKKAKSNPKAKSNTSLAGRMLRWLLTWTIVISIAALLSLQAVYFARVMLLVNNNPASSAFMQARAAQLESAGAGQKLRYYWVPIEQISVNLQRAVLVAEDARFADHFGIDWRALHRAWTINQARDGIAFGGSTITMQLAKNLYLSGERSYWRKAQEASIALMLELVLSKERILELYLNLSLIHISEPTRPY